jgi:hypothetical protein
MLWIGTGLIECYRFYRFYRFLSISHSISSLSLCHCFLLLFYFYLYSISTQRTLVSISTYILRFMSLISTTDDLGGSYRRFRCPSKHIHQLYPADDSCWPPFIALGSSMLKLSRSEASSTRGPTARVSVLSFYLKTEKIQLSKRCNFIEM